MNYDFDSLIDKNKIGNMKYNCIPKNILNKGLSSYSGAEMDFPTAPSIIKSLEDFIKKGCFGFTLCDDYYLEKVKKWMEKERNYFIEKSWIVPTHGTIFSLSTTIRALTSIGDGVIISPPIYHRYEQAVNRLERKIVYNHLIEQNGIYSIDFNDLETIFKKSNNKIYILCNPHNPISKVWNKEDLDKIAFLAKKYNVIVFSDEIFAEVTYNNYNMIPFSDIKNAKDISIVSTSLGKTFSLTGVNHANIIIPNEDLRKKFINQRDSDHYGSIDPFLYFAIKGAYSKDGASWKNEMVKYVEENGKLFIDFFKENFPEILVSPYEGTYAIWVNWKSLNLSDYELENFLTNKSYLHVDMGREYGGHPYNTRLSVALPRNLINKNLNYLYDSLIRL